VEVPDERLTRLAEVENSDRIVHPAIQFVDIAGLIRGAHKGEGLGNKFLANIREVDAIAMVVRSFENDEVMRVDSSQGGGSPKDDIETVMTELILADMETIGRRKEAMEKEARTDKDVASALEVIKKIERVMADGKPSIEAGLDEEEKAMVHDLHLLTMKPFIYVFNVSEDQITVDSADILDDFGLSGEMDASRAIIISAIVEAELATFDSEEDRQDYLDTLGVKESGLIKLVKKAYEVLKLKSFLTAGPMEARAWTFRDGVTIREAVGVIHGDFVQRFIKAEVAKYDDFVRCEGWAKTKEKGLVRLEGKSYLVQDGDIVYIHHS
jgi:hypothetical protein